MIAALLREANGAADTEAALRVLTVHAQATLGDHGASRRPGALREGERDYRVAGVFLITPDRRYNMLVASVGFPPEQRRLMIPIDWNHPGIVARDEAPLLVRDTDQDTRFRQFLKTSRMGSSAYAPMRFRGVMAGQIVVAAQARGTYREADLAALVALADLAACAFHAHGGSAWLAADYPASDAWRAEEHVEEIGR